MPANHWQAEDRAYRIGQTGTVNVTYMVGSDTIDEFVRAVLSTKAELVDAVIEGKAVSGAAYTGVLEELERALGALSPRLADVSAADLDDEQIGQLLRELASTQPTEADAGASGPAARALDPSLARKALLALARALKGPEVTKYRVASSSSPGAVLHAGRQRRTGRRVLLPGVRVPRSMPSRARPEAGARSRRGGAGGIRAGDLSDEWEVATTASASSVTTCRATCTSSSSSGPSPMS